MSASRLSNQFIHVARARVSDSSLRSEGNLRRTTSDLYFAAFHAICEALVEPLGAYPDNPAFREIFLSLYRQPDHGIVENKCKIVARGDKFSVGICRFAKQFVNLKYKRQLADYHPLEKFMISAVRNDCDTTEARLEAFWSVDATERATFACFVGLKSQRMSREPDQS